MTKQEYFETLLKRDFIDNVLLQKPRFDDATVAAKLKSDIDKDLLYSRLKTYISGVLDKFFTEDRIKDRKGRIVNLLPEWLNNSLVETVRLEFRTRIEHELSTVTFIPQIMAHIERLTWAQGVDDMIHNLQQFKIELNKMSTHYGNINPLSPAMYELDRKYQDAHRVTLRERIMEDNYKDVKIYFDAMARYCHALCEEEIALYLSRFYGKLAKAPEFEELICKYRRIQAEAEAEKERLVPDEYNPDWEKEYQELIPTDFYRRNIKTINATKAFQMAFIKSLTRFEPVLREQGYLDEEGELILFTNPRYDGLRWLNTNFALLL